MTELERVKAELEQAKATIVSLREEVSLHLAPVPLEEQDIDLDREIERSRLIAARERRVREEYLCGEAARKNRRPVERSKPLPEHPWVTELNEMNRELEGSAK